MLFGQRNVKVMNTDLEHGLKSVITAIFYCINKTLLTAFFVHRRKSWGHFRIIGCAVSFANKQMNHICSLDIFMQQSPNLPQRLHLTSASRVE